MLCVSQLTIPKNIMRIDQTEKSVQHAPPSPNNRQQEQRREERRRQRKEARAGQPLDHEI